MTRARDLAAFVSNADGDIKFDTDTLFIDSSANKVGIGNTSPPEFLTIGDATSDGASRIQFFSTTSGVNTIHFGDGASAAAYRGYIQYAHSNDSLAIGTSASDKIIVDADGKVGLSAATPAYQLDLQGGATNNDRLRLLRGTDDANQFMTMGWNNISTHRANVALASAQTNLKFNQVGSDGTRTAMEIDSGKGRVLMPNQPFGVASSNAAATATSKIQLTSNMVSRGGLGIDSGTERMTVPVAGAYFIGYHHLSENPSSQVEIRINGVAQGGSRTQGPNGAGSNHSITSFIIRELSANDYVEWWCVSGKTHSNNNYNSMVVTFLG